MNVRPSTVVFAAILLVISLPGRIAVAASPREVLRWDAREKTFRPGRGETVVNFTFTARNLSAEPVVVAAVTTSCRCTTAQFPEAPCVIAPHGAAILSGAVQLSGKRGEVTETVFIESSAGADQVTVRIFLPDSGAADAPRR